MHGRLARAAQESRIAVQDVGIVLAESRSGREGVLCLRDLVQALVDQAGGFLDVGILGHDHARVELPESNERHLS